MSEKKTKTETKSEEKIAWSNWTVKYREFDMDDLPLFRYLASFYDKFPSTDALRRGLKDNYLREVIYKLARKYGLSTFGGSCQQQYPDAYVNLQYNNPFLPERKTKMEKLEEHDNIQRIHRDNRLAKNR